MAKKPISVDTFFSQLEHPLATAMQSLRSGFWRAIRLSASASSGTRPAFAFAGDDRVTYRLPPKGGFQLIFHRGAKLKDSQGLTFTTPLSACFSSQN